MLEVMRAVGLLARMRANQRKSREELERVQLEGLDRLVRYASAHVPAYSGLPGIRSLEDVRSLPTLAKGDVRARPERFTSRAFPPASLRRQSTSGSTGRPLTVFYGPGDTAHELALEYLALTETGVGPHDVQARITLEPCYRTGLEALGLFRRRHVPFHSARQAVSDLKRISPTVIRSAPSFLAPLAYENTASDAGLSIRRAYTFSEVLSPRARGIISGSLGCSLFDMYGAVETSWMAWECERGSMHVNSDSFLLEVLGPDGEPVKEGKLGDAAVTTLWKRSMPLIRYLIGDRLALGGKCACGRGSHVISHLQGRANDLIILPSGRTCSAHVLTFILRSEPGVIGFQSVQESPERIVTRIIPEGNGPDIQSLAKRLEAAIPEQMSLELELVESLDSKRGKRADFVCRAGKPDFW